MNKTIVRAVALGLAVVMLLGLLAGIVMADEYNPGQNRTLYSSAEFEAEFTYEGDDLGAVWTADSTTFRVWAPTADAVTVNLYQCGTPGTDDLIDQVTMTADVNGTWVATVAGDLNGTYYTYLVDVEGMQNEACDPYARTTGVNGAKVESSLFAVPINHMFWGSLSLPPRRSAGSPFCTSDTTSMYRFSGSGISSSERNSAK